MLEVLLSALTIIAIVTLIGWLVMQPQDRVLKISLPLSVISFVLIYFIYLAASLRPGDPLFSVAGAMKAFVETYLSVINGIDYGALTESPALEGLAGTVGFETFFWFLHVLLFAMLAVSGFAVWGRKLMDAVRLRMAFALGKRNVYHIFGQSEGALQLGRNIMAEEPKALVVYYSEEYSEELREEISGFGGALVEVNEESRARALERAESNYPTNVALFGGVWGETVNGDNVADLLARKAVRDHAPYKTMGVFGAFPDTPYEAVVVGFGDVGRSCACWLIENAQLNLNGKTPCIHVVDKNAIAFQRFMIENPGIGSCAELSFLEADVFSWEFRDYLVGLMASCAVVPQVFVCVSPVDARTNQELTEHRDRDSQAKSHIESILKRQTAYAPGMVIAPSLENEDLWTPEIILHRRLDQLAIAMNGHYGDKDKTYESEAARKQAHLEAWKKTPDAHKNSSRAACDFFPAFLALAGVDPQAEDARSQYAARLEEDDALLEALAQIEHKRWMAFHYVNGYTPMPFEVFEARIDDYQRPEGDRRKVAKPQQDAETKEHVCLVEWGRLPELDTLYARYDEGIENGETLQGRDRNNVLLLTQLQ